MKDFWIDFKEMYKASQPEFWGGLVLLIVIFFWQRILSKFKALIVSIKTFYSFTKAKEKYKIYLNAETLKLSHFWTIKGKSLKEFLLPINVYDPKNNRKCSLDEYFVELFKLNRIPSTIILGEAGSGKSIALGFLARTIINHPFKRKMLPILLTFSEIKHVRNKQAFEEVLSDVLKRNQFKYKKRSDLANSFLQVHLYEGNIILLIDGFDEVEKQTRFEIAKFLQDFFQMYPTIPFVITSRNSVWNQSKPILTSQNEEILFMADLSPKLIRQYIYCCDFSQSKTPEQLNEIIKSNEYLKQIVIRPLVLNIVCFFYSQLEKDFPDNKVEFYKECVDTLLEKWDESKFLNRNNFFDKIDKETILSLIAYKHITSVNGSNDEISKESIITFISQEINENREKLLNELSINAELLIQISPSEYKFIHRTFLEYFAALFFKRENKHIELLNYYKADHGKWEETLCFFCGINNNVEVSEMIYYQLKEDFLFTNNSPKSNTLLFRALTEGLKLTDTISNEIFILLENYLNSTIDSKVLKYLSYLLVTQKREYHSRVKDIILLLLKKKLSKKDFQEVILTLAPINDFEVKTLVLKHLDQIDLVQLLIRLGEQTEYYVVKLLENIPEEKYEAVFTGLKEADQMELIFRISLESDKMIIKQIAAWYFLQNKDLNLDRYKLVSFDLNDLPLKLQNEIQENQIMFPKFKLANERNSLNELAIILLCYQVKELLTNHKYFQKIIDTITEIDIKYRFLINFFLLDDSNLLKKLNSNEKLIEIPILIKKKGASFQWVKKNQTAQVMGTILMPLLAIGNLYGIIQYYSSNIYQLIIGIIFMLSFISYMFVFVIDFKNKTLDLILSYFIYFFAPQYVMTAYILENPYDKIVKFKVNYLLLYALGIIFLCIIFPLPIFFKIFDCTIIILLSIIGFFCSYVGVFSKIFQNRQIQYIVGQAKESERIINEPLY